MATYYIKNTGNDSLDGLSNANAWATITKVNSTWLAGTFNPGDSILFNKNDSFTGTINVSESGNVGSPITIGAYGTGVKPIINGFTTIPSWTSVDGSVYYYDITCQSATNNLVTVNGVNTAMGRWPNTGWRTYTAVSAGVSITDSSLTNTPNWTGAELVVRKINWTLERLPITNHSTTLITYSRPSVDWGSSGGTPGYGYFIQNDLKTLTNLGDWYYNGTRLYMYFGSANPSDYVVKISTLDKLVTSGISGSTYYNYITLDGIAFEGSSLSTVEIISNTHHWTIQNCNFDFAGKNCIDGFQYIHDLLIDNNYINHTNNSAIRSIYLGYHNIVTNNNINNTGVLIGMMYSDDDGGDAINLKDDGIDTSTFDIVSNNRIINTGHTACRVRYNNYIVSNNFIDTFALTKNDAGGLYTWGTYYTTFQNNIIINGYGQSGGVLAEHDFDPPDPFFVNVVGIYIDERTDHISILNNTTANNRDGGIFIQMARDITITGNTSYNNGWFQIALLSRLVTDVDPIRNVAMNNNIFFSKAVGRALFPYLQLCMWAQSWETVTDINQFGTFDNNYYARPIDQLTNADTFTVYEHWPASPWNGTLMNLNEWKTLSGQDANSLTSSVSISTTNDLHFIYNDTLINKNYTLSSSMKDVANTDYSSAITLLPFTSLVLIGSGTVTEGAELTLTEGTWLANRTTLNEMFQNLYSRFF